MVDGIADTLKVNGIVVAIPEKLLVKEPVAVKQRVEVTVTVNDGDLVNGCVVAIPDILTVNDGVLVNG
jgi:hypothetical protein